MHPLGTSDFPKFFSIYCTAKFGYFVASNNHLPSISLYNDQKVCDLLASMAIWFFNYDFFLKEKISLSLIWFLICFCFYFSIDSINLWLTTDLLIHFPLRRFIACHCIGIIPPPPTTVLPSLAEPIYQCRRLPDLHCCMKNSFDLITIHAFSLYV
jgi:hypothetical protein